MRLYHRTNSADVILREGFRDAEGSYGLATIALRGVFVSDEPLSINEGATGEQLLALDLSDDVDLSSWELVNAGAGYREWCVPAAVLNQATLHLLSLEEEDRLAERGSDWAERRARVRKALGLPPDDNGH